MLLIIFLYMFLSRRNCFRAQNIQLPETPTEKDNNTSIIPELKVSPVQASDVLVTPHHNTYEMLLGQKSLDALQTRDSHELYT